MTRISTREVLDVGNIDKERVVFNVSEDELLGTYMVFSTTKTGEKTISSLTKDTYWFPDKEVKRGDLVVLYTKHGKNNSSQNKNGTTTYFFYWGKANPVWNNDNFSVVIARIESWSFKPVIA